jgi:hypothetical protein
MGIMINNDKELQKIKKKLISQKHLKGKDQKIE